MPRGDRLRRLQDEESRVRVLASKLPDTREGAIGHFLAERRDSMEAVILSENTSRFDADEYRLRLECVVAIADLLRAEEPEEGTQIHPNNGEDIYPHAFYLSQLLTPLKWRDSTGASLKSLESASLAKYLKRSEHEEEDLWLAREANLTFRFLEEVEKAWQKRTSKAENRA